MNSEPTLNTIDSRDGNPVRYKTLTAEQVRKWHRWKNEDENPGRDWVHGLRVYAFEDGSVFFQDSGSPLRQVSRDKEEVAEWIEFLNTFRQGWECRTCAA